MTQTRLSELSTSGAGVAVDPEGQTARGPEQQPVDDFPAAHSGDVDWFAVDAQGCVAHFHSWEPGAPVPKGATWQFSEALERPPGIRSKTIFDLEAALHIFNERWYGVNQIAVPSYGYPSVQEIRRKRLGRVRMIVQSLDVVREALDNRLAKLALQRPAGPPYAVDFETLPRDLAEQILRSGQCLSCRSVDLEDSISNGLFRYVHSGRESGDGPNGPYLRQTAPADPVTVDELESPLRAIIEEVRFEQLSFLDSPLVQPLEHFQCRGNGYIVSADGRRLQGASVEAQREWDQEIRERDARREQALRDLAAWPERALAAAGSWFGRLISTIENYREANPTDVVLVSLEFPTQSISWTIARQLPKETTCWQERNERRVMFRDVGINCKQPGKSFEGDPAPPIAGWTNGSKAVRFPSRASSWVPSRSQD